MRKVGMAEDAGAALNPLVRQDAAPGQQAGVSGRLAGGEYDHGQRAYVLTRRGDGGMPTGRLGSAVTFFRRFLLHG